MSKLSEKQLSYVVIKLVKQLNHGGCINRQMSVLHGFNLNGHQHLWLLLALPQISGQLLRPFRAEVRTSMLTSLRNSFALANAATRTWHISDWRDVTAAAPARRRCFIDTLNEFAQPLTVV